MIQANQLASVILARNGPWMDAMSLQKLLYYVQAWHLAVTDRPVFAESIKAWKDGPVVPQVWHSRRAPESRRAVVQEATTVPVDDLTSELIDLVITVYGSMSGAELSALTHVEEPWAEARGGLSESASSDKAIDPATMARFYRAERRLAGRTAADLAAGGVYGQSSEKTGPVDVDGLLARIPAGGSSFNDPWGGANLLPQANHDGAQEPLSRARAGA